MMEDKYKGGVDNYLVYQRDGQKVAFLIEAKHNLTKENVSLNLHFKNFMIITPDYRIMEVKSDE